MSAGKKLAIGLVWLVLLGGAAVAFRYRDNLLPLLGVAVPGEPVDALVQRFDAAWEVAVVEGTDSPSVDEYTAKAAHGSQAAARERLSEVDKLKRQKHRGRVRLALDAFSGYSIFRSREFMDRVHSAGVPLYWADDKADYNARINALKSGEAPLAVFTFDALINASAQFPDKDLPAVAVMLIDESRGADAILGYKKDFPTANSIDALNRPDVKVVFTQDSPSEALTRVVRSKHTGAPLPADYMVKVKGPDEVLEQFKAHAKAKPGTPPKAFVLWEPFVSQALAEAPDAHVLVDSAHFDGYIVDILVAQREYLQKNPDTVQKVVKAYFEALVKSEGKEKRTRLVIDDARKTDTTLAWSEAERLVDKIWWKTAKENFAHFGIEGTGLQPIEAMVKNITDVLVSTNAISKDPTGGNPQLLYDDSVLRRLATGGVGATTAAAADDDKPLSSEEWQKLQPLYTVPMEPIEFGRGDAEVPKSSLVPQQVAAVLKQSPRYFLEVRGYTLRKGDPEANRTLARERAKNVAKQIEEQGGIPAHHIRAVNMDNTDAEEKPQVTFVLLQKP